MGKFHVERIGVRRQANMVYCNSLIYECLVYLFSKAIDKKILCAIESIHNS